MTAKNSVPRPPPTSNVIALHSGAAARQAALDVLASDEARATVDALSPVERSRLARAIVSSAAQVCGEGMPAEARRAAREMLAESSDDDELTVAEIMRRLIAHGVNMPHSSRSMIANYARSADRKSVV